MANRLVKRVEYEYVPAIREVLPQPAYCITTETRRAVSGGTSGSTYQVPIQAVPPASTTYTTNTQYVTQRRTQCFSAVPGIPGVPEKWLAVDDLGWGSGARSAGIFVGDFLFSFDFGRDISGALCGLTTPQADAPPYNAIRYGLRLVGDTCAVVESGIVISTLPYSAGTPVAIQRVAGMVTYFVGDWVYTSSKRVDTPLMVASCLYVNGDYVDNPVIHPVQRIADYISWGWEDFGTATAISAQLPWGWSASASMGDGVATIAIPLVLRGSEVEGGVAGLVVHGPTARANDAPRLEVSGMSPQLSMLLTGRGVSIHAGGAELHAGGVVVRASDYDVGTAVLRLDAPFVWGLSTGEAPGVGAASELAVVYDTYTTDPIVYAHIDGTLRVGGTIDVLLVLDAALVDYLIAGDTLTASALLYALISSDIQLSDSVGSTRNAVLQYATNVLTGAVGRYEGFDFRGFTRVGMKTYGWKPDGLYRLAHAEDTGEELQAMIDFAAEDFDTTSRKSVRALFFGADTDGALYARLVDDNDCDAIYRVIPHGDTQRANPAQRPTSRFWRLRLEIVDATFADIDNVEWKVATTGRRTRS